MTPPAAAAAPAVSPRRAVPGRGPLSVPGRPRRVSGPARPPARARPAPERRARNSTAETGLALGLIEALRRLSRSRLLDRLIQGRISIAIVAFALIGIVTMQLGLLKLNAGIGRALERTAVLQRENAALSIENSEMAAGDRVELQAGHLGMVLISPGALHFLALGSTAFEADRAVTALSTPVASAPVGASAASPASVATEGSSPAGEGNAASSSGEASGEATTAPVPSASGTAPVSEAARQATTAPQAGEAARQATPPPPAGAGEGTGSPSTSGASEAASGGSGEAAAGPSAPTGGGATAPSG